MGITANEIVAIAYDCCLSAVKANSIEEVNRLICTMRACLTPYGVKSSIMAWIGCQMREAYGAKTFPCSFDMLMDLVKSVRI